MTDYSDLMNPYSNLGNKSLSNIFNFSFKGIGVLLLSLMISSSMLPLISNAYMTLATVAAILAIIASIAMSYYANSQQINKAKLSYYIMAAALGFGMMPVISRAIHSQQGTILLLLSCFVLLVQFKALAWYAERQENKGLKPSLRTSVLIYLLLLITMLGTVAAAMPAVPILHVLYCGAGIVLFSLFLTTDFMLALKYSKKNTSNECEELLLGANIMLSTTNMFCYILELFLSSEDSKISKGPIEIIRILIAVILIVPVLIYLIYKLIAGNNEEKTHQLAASPTNSELFNNGPYTTFNRSNLNTQEPTSSYNPLART